MAKAYAAQGEVIAALHAIGDPDLMTVWNAA
jgi:hypothetical protein